MRRGKTRCMLVQLDPAVIKQAQGGDEAAFRLIVRTYEVPVFNFILRTVGDRELAEDLTQDTFLRVLRALPRFGHRAKFSTWVMQIAKNLVLDDRRARARRPQCVDVEYDVVAPAFDAPGELTETIDALWVAVEGLSVDLKEALVLRDVLGLSYEEIGETLDIAGSTVKWRIWKARETVQRALVDAGLTSGG